MPARKTEGTIKVTHKFLTERDDLCRSYGYNTPKWIQFCRVMMPLVDKVTLYEARQTKSKYIGLHKTGFKSYKVRFSDHKPNKNRELAGHCDFFVGWTHTGVRTTEMAINTVCQHFRLGKYAASVS